MNLNEDSLHFYNTPQKNFKKYKIYKLANKDQTGKKL